MTEDVVGSFGVGGVEYLVHSGGCHGCVFDDLICFDGKKGCWIVSDVFEREPSGSSLLKYFVRQ